MSSHEEVTVGPRAGPPPPEGLLVGHAERIDAVAASGVSVLLAPEGAVAGVDVRGGGPGTRETDALAPGTLVDRVHAVVLAGGSAYGLAAADGVMSWLAERGHGLAVGPAPHEVVPLVPCAVIFDLPQGQWGARPDAGTGHLACQQAAREAASGTIGAGAGATAGSLQGGVGVAEMTVPAAGTGNYRVWAMLVVNAYGEVVDPVTGLPWDAGSGVGPSRFGLRSPPEAERAAGAEAARAYRDARAAGPALNTTIGVVATDAPLSVAQCRRMASNAHDGLALAIRPSHLLYDGDTLFGLSTTGSGAEADAATMVEVCAAATTVVAAAVVDAALSAQPLPASGPSAAGRVRQTYRSRYPGALARA